MKHSIQEKRKRFSAIQIIRAVIQLAAFLLIPGLFISVFSGIGAIYTALIGGTFVFSEQIGNILLVAAVFLITALWGRFFCGYICSFGAMQDLLWQIGKRIVRKPLIPERADRVLKHLKYAVLLFIVVGVWTFGVGSAAIWSPWTVFGMYASPWAGLPATLAFLSLGGALLALIIVGSLFIERFFCKYLCPLGALFTLASRFRLFRIKKPSAACGNCRMCSRNCSMAIPLYQHDEVRSGECIDCMRCVGACRRNNVKASAVPAVCGTLAATAIAGVTFMGNIIKTDTALQAATQKTVISTESVGKFKDGLYKGSAPGFRGFTDVTVKVSSGMISEITVDTSFDDNEYLSKASKSVIPAIIEAQDTDVDTVSGATYSSQAIINAAKDALSLQLASDSTDTSAETGETAPAETQTEEATLAPTEQETGSESNDEAFSDDTAAGTFADGVYNGSGSGYRGTTEVAVTVENGAITDITVTSYQDDSQFFFRAEEGVIAAILSEQSVEVDSVSGATFSSNSIKEAVASALDLSYSNPNSSMGGSSHGPHGMHMR